MKLIIEIFYLNDARPGKAQSLLPNILGEDDTAGPHKQAVLFFHILIRETKNKGFNFHIQYSICFFFFLSKLLLKNQKERWRDLDDGDGEDRFGSIIAEIMPRYRRHVGNGRFFRVTARHIVSDTRRYPEQNQPDPVVTASNSLGLHFQLSRSLHEACGPLFFGVLVGPGPLSFQNSRAQHLHQTRFYDPS